MSRQWVVQELLAEANEEADWDLWVIGTVDGDAFEERCRTYSKDDSVFIMAAVRWFEAFEEGNIKPAVVPVKKVAAKPRRKRV